MMLLEGQWQAAQAFLATVARTDALLNLQPNYDIYGVAALPDIHLLVEQLSSKSRLLQVIAQQREQLKHLQGGLRDSQRPQLDLIVGAGIQKNDSKIDKAILPNKPNFSVGVNFFFPMKNRAVKSRIAQSEIQFKQLDATIRTTKVELEAQLQQLLIEMRSIEKVLLLNREQIVSAQQKTAEEEKLYNQGRGVFNFVLLSRSNELNARLTHAQNAVAYHTLLLQYRALLDELLSKRGLL